MLLNALGGFGDTFPFKANAVDFDGANDYLERGAGLTGAADNKFCLISFWMKSISVPSVEVIMRSDGSVFGINQNTTGPTLSIRDTGALDVTTTATTGSNVWQHIILSCDLSDSGKRYLYVDGVDDSPTWTTYNDVNIDWTRTDWAIGADVGGSNKYDGQLAEFYVTNEYLDISNAANLAKFRNPDSGTPVDLGRDGAVPTGTAPLVYFTKPVDDWHINAGSGGGFTENGALTEAATDPN